MQGERRLLTPGENGKTTSSMVNKKWSKSLLNVRQMSAAVHTRRKRLTIEEEPLTCSDASQMLGKQLRFLLLLLLYSLCVCTACKRGKIPSSNLHNAFQDQSFQDTGLLFLYLATKLKKKKKGKSSKSKVCWILKKREAKIKTVNAFFCQKSYRRDLSLFRRTPAAEWKKRTGTTKNGQIASLFNKLFYKKFSEK